MRRVREGVILFADDSVDDRFLMLQACKEAGFEDKLVSVDDGEEAVAYLEKASADPGSPATRPRLAILDLNMPRKNGFETLEWIRKSPRWMHMPVLMLTASAHPGDARTATLMGANAFLVKPTTARELIEMVQAINAFWLRWAFCPMED